MALLRAEFSVRFRLALSTILTLKMRLRLFNERGVPKYFLVRKTGQIGLNRNDDEFVALNIIGLYTYYKPIG